MGKIRIKTGCFIIGNNYLPGGYPRGYPLRALEKLKKGEQK
jgi:hypothetical protein